MSITEINENEQRERDKAVLSLLGATVAMQTMALRLVLQALVTERSLSPHTARAIVLGVAGFGQNLANSGDPFGAIKLTADAYADMATDYPNG